MEQLTAGLVGALVATVVTLGVSFAQMRQAKTSQRVLAQQEITAKYDRMVDYRLLKPEVLTLAHHWTPRCFAAIYDQKSDADRGWAYYYGYIELAITYCNAVLHAKSKGLLDRDLYEMEHEPLIRLLLVEHYPILSSIVREDGFVTKYLVEHVAALRESGWDWSGEHDRYMDM